jgi:hypothetical protein
VTAYTQKRYGFFRQHLLDRNVNDPIEAITTLLSVLHFGVISSDELLVHVGAEPFLPSDSPSKHFA